MMCLIGQILTNHHASLYFSEEIRNLTVGVEDDQKLIETMKVNVKDAELAVITDEDGLQTAEVWYRIDLKYNYVDRNLLKQHVKN